MAFLGILTSDQLAKYELCQLVANPVIMDLSQAENPYDNGYSEERYHQVLDTVLATFGPAIAERGGSLEIWRDWSDGAVNAWAERWGERYILEVPGGMARYYLITEEGFLTTICHELGHLIGGSPHSRTISYEGQADYYSTMKCMEGLLTALDYPDTRAAELPACKGSFCEARLMGAKSLSSYYASLARTPAPALETPSRARPAQTLRSHPEAQCRFDTMVAGLLCGNRNDFSYDNAHDGACPDVPRPRCWWVPEERETEYFLRSVISA